MSRPRIIAALLAAALPAVLMAAPASAAKRDGEVEMTQNLTPSGLVAMTIPLPPPGPFNAPLKPVLTVPPMAMPSTAPPLEAALTKVNPATYPPVDFDPEAAATPMQPEDEYLPAASPALVETRTAPARRAGWPQNYRPQANRMPPAYGVNPYARARQQNWGQNWQPAPGWPAPNRAYRPYPVQPDPSGQMGRPTP